ncbi:hypothetical protein DPEC_G00110910 [Dallia pectoralis]|uniref:Uncharacterized protein n=1 Tax=Dallia pectoralis TaxID=75939 RepID=A0ACC2GST5_DALPE|nr:hypothetical protein DPEC_G00110910 [Dallia pectoralis]
MVLKSSEQQAVGGFAAPNQPPKALPPRHPSCTALKIACAVSERVRARSVFQTDALVLTWCTSFDPHGRRAKLGAQAAPHATPPHTPTANTRARTDIGTHPPVASQNKQSPGLPVRGSIRNNPRRSTGPQCKLVPVEPVACWPADARCWHGPRTVY